MQPVPQTALPPGVTGPDPAARRADRAPDAGPAGRAGVPVTGDFAGVLAALNRSAQAPPRGGETPDDESPPAASDPVAVAGLPGQDPEPAEAPRQGVPGDALPVNERADRKPGIALSPLPRGAHFLHWPGPAFGADRAIAAPEDAAGAEPAFPGRAGPTVRPGPEPMPPVVPVGAGPAQGDGALSADAGPGPLATAGGPGSAPPLGPARDPMAATLSLPPDRRDQALLNRVPVDPRLPGILPDVLPDRVEARAAAAQRGADTPVTRGPNGGAEGESGFAAPTRTGIAAPVAAQAAIVAMRGAADPGGSVGPSHAVAPGRPLAPVPGVPVVAGGGVVASSGPPVPASPGGVAQPADPAPVMPRDAAGAHKIASGADRLRRSDAPNPGAPGRSVSNPELIAAWRLAAARDSAGPVTADRAVPASLPPGLDSSPLSDRDRVPGMVRAAQPEPRWGQEGMALRMPIAKGTEALNLAPALRPMPPNVAATAAPSAPQNVAATVSLIVAPGSPPASGDAVPAPPSRPIDAAQGPAATPPAADWRGQVAAVARPSSVQAPEPGVQNRPVPSDPSAGSDRAGSSPPPPAFSATGPQRGMLPVGQIRAVDPGAPQALPAGPASGAAATRAEPGPRGPGAVVGQPLPARTPGAEILQRPLPPATAPVSDRAGPSAPHTIPPAAPGTVSSGSQTGRERGAPVDLPSEPLASRTIQPLAAGPGAAAIATSPSDMSRGVVTLVDRPTRIATAPAPAPVPADGGALQPVAGPRLAEQVALVGAKPLQTAGPNPVAPTEPPAPVQAPPGVNPLRHEPRAASPDQYHAPPSGARDDTPAVWQPRALAPPAPAAGNVPLPAAEPAPGQGAPIPDLPAGAGALALGPGGLPAAGPVPLPGYNPQTVRPARGTAGQIAGQIADRISAPMPRGSQLLSTELALTPPELGRITIRFESDAGNGVLVLQVERPDTLDLMRRHQELLQDALRAAGHEGCSVMLGGRDPAQGGTRRDSGSDRSVDGRADDDGDGPAGPSPIRSSGGLAASGRLDLRF
jgi:flagellar hook-length control protein FliK